MPPELTPWAAPAAFMLGLVAVVLAGLRALMSGRLWTKSAVDKLESAYRDAVDAAERREQTAMVAYQAAEERAKVRDVQAQQAMEMMATMTQVWQAVQQLVARAGPGDRTGSPM